MLHLVVFSGLSNRLFAIISAMRYARQTQQEIIIYWYNPVSRYGLPYEGTKPEVEHLNCFFKKLPNITLKTWVPELIDNLKREGNAMVYDGTEIIPQFMQKNPDGSTKFPSDFNLLISRPLGFPRMNNIIVNMPTHPWGFDDDPMATYKNYPNEPGMIKVKSQYERELSKFAKKLEPISSLLSLIRHHQSLFNDSTKSLGHVKKLGIHIRRSDLKTNVTDEQLDNIIDKYVNQYTRSHGIWITSDDLEIQNRYLSKYPKVIGYTDPTKTQNNLVGVQKALVDLYILASCDHILGTAGSSFSYFSWMLANDSTTFEIHS